MCNYLLHGGKAVPETQETERAKQSTTCGTKAITHSFRRKPRKKKDSNWLFSDEGSENEDCQYGLQLCF